MPSHTLAVSEAAEAVGVTIHSLRRWCEWHAGYLSPGANPLPGQARRLTGVDIEVLRHVKVLRDEGLQTIAINAKLSGLTFAEIDERTDDTDITVVDAPDAPDKAPASIVADSAIATMQSDIAALKASAQYQAQGQRDYVQGIGVGFVVALLFMIVLLGLAVLYGGVR